MEKIMLTIEGKRRLEEKLKIERDNAKELVQSITDAKDKGDISENSEYESAKYDYEMVQQKISNLENTLFNSVVISSTDIDTSVVSLLTKVKTQNIKDKKEMEFKIVPENEINLKERKISHKSPIGSSLMGKKKGDVVKVEVPSGVLNLKIMKISA